MSAQFETKIDFTSPIWNRDTWARMQGDLNPENQKFSDVRGVILGIKPNEKTKELCGFEAFLATRLVPQTALPTLTETEDRTRQLQP